MVPIHRTRHKKNCPPRLPRGEFVSSPLRGKFSSCGGVPEGGGGLFICPCGAMDTGLVPPTEFTNSAGPGRRYDGSFYS